MKKINFVKFTLDLIMGIIFALLFNTHVLGGMSFHEIAGLAIGFAILIHIVLNWKWVKNVTLSIFSKKIALRTRIGYILNILLLLDMAVIIISGIFISKVLFPQLRMQNIFFNQRTHTAAAYLALALIGIHLGMHWKWVMSVFKKIIHINKSSKALEYISKGTAVLILAFGIYSMVSVNYLPKTVQIFGVGSQTTMGGDKGMRPDFQFNGSPQAGGGTVGDDQNSGSNSNSNDSPQGWQGGMSGKPNFANRGKGMQNGKGMGSTNIFSVLAKYMSITAVFTVFIYYFESLILKRKALKN